jgi:GNAT superfamily N-acetyltransferase
MIDHEESGMPSPVNLRTPRAIDGPGLVALVSELGYSATSEQMRDRLEIARSDPQCAVFVAESDSIVGWIHVVRSLTLESGVCSEIRGLVVAESHRGQGIGRALVGAAENWAAGHGCTNIRVRTNVVRDDAQAFYLKLGYAVSKTQRVFDKSLANIENVGTAGLGQIP